MQRAAPGLNLHTTSRHFHFPSDQRIEQLSPVTTVTNTRSIPFIPVANLPPPTPFQGWCVRQEQGADALANGWRVVASGDSAEREGLALLRRDEDGREDGSLSLNRTDASPSERVRNRSSFAQS